MKSLITSSKIEKHIYVIHNQTVMLDSDLAKLYGVTTKSLNRAVRRHLNRFPTDFAFLLNPEDIENLRYQIGTSSWGGRRYRPYVFTQEGVAMLSSVLNSTRAIQVNIEIMRAFIRLKGFHLSYGELRKEIQDMRIKYDKNFSIVFNAIERLLDGPHKKVHVRGFTQNQKKFL